MTVFLIQFCVVCVVLLKIDNNLENSKFTFTSANKKKLSGKMLGRNLEKTQKGKHSLLGDT